MSFDCPPDPGISSFRCWFPLALWIFSSGYVLLCVCSVAQSCPTLGPHGLKAARLLCPWDSPDKNTGVGCHSLLQGIFPTQGSSPHLLPWQGKSCRHFKLKFTSALITFPPYLLCVLNSLSLFIQAPKHRKSWLVLGFLLPLGFSVSKITDPVASNRNKAHSSLFLCHDQCLEASLDSILLSLSHWSFSSEPLSHCPQSYFSLNVWSCYSLS